MAYGVTSWFIDQTQLKSPTVKRQLLIGTSDYSGRVTKWPSIKRRWNEIQPTDISLELANEDQALNLFKTDKTKLRAECTVKVGFTHPTSGDELITMYVGTVEKVTYRRGAIELSLLDKIKEFTERVIGSSDVPVSYTGSNYLPSDIAWWLCTSYGNKSAIQSTSNPDIDWTSFQAWASVFSGNSVFVEAKFDGQKINEALRKLGRYTDSAIFVEGNKLTFIRFAEAHSYNTQLGAGQISNVVLTIDDTRIINKQHVYAAYSGGNDMWAIDVISVATNSVNSFGVREDVEKDENIWYVTSAHAQNLAQRRTSFLASPYEQYVVDTTLVALPRQIGETVNIEDSFLSVSSSTSWRVMEYQLDLDKGAMKLTIDQSRLQQAFTLDDATLGLLDQDYNPLL